MLGTILVAGCLALSAQLPLAGAVAEPTSGVPPPTARAEPALTPTALSAGWPTPDASGWYAARYDPAVLIEGTVPLPTPTRVQTPTPLAALTQAARAPGAPAASVPVLMYHYIRINPDPADRIGAGLSVSPADFEAQLEFLARQGYRTLLPRDLAVPVSPGERVVAITFDDGYADAYTAALPVLNKYGFKATFYIITEFVGRPRYLTWEQLNALAAGGHTIGSHTLNHPDLRQLGAHELRRQLTASKAELERQLGQPVLDLCFPSGSYNAAVVAAAREAGYATAVTTRYAWHAPAESPLEISRVRVSGGGTLAQFAAALQP